MSAPRLRLPLLALCFLWACSDGRTMDPGTGGGGEKDATPRIDTGVVVDTGVEDTGVAVEDTGVAVEDTGVAPADTGVAPEDTGVAPADTGLVEDTGVAPEDTGVAPADTGVAPEDTGVVEDTGVRADTGTVADGGTPADATALDAAEVLDVGFAPDATPPPDAGFSDIGFADAGTADAGAADTGVTADASAPDAAGADAGVMPGACIGATQLPNNGMATGTTAGEADDYAGGCHGTGGPDVVYRFSSPGRLVSLRATTLGSNFDTALHVYRGGCDPAMRLACDDDGAGGAGNSLVTLTNQPSGTYYAIVDGFGVASGMYQLAVTGVLGVGELCDPTQTWLSCEVGTCSPDATGGFSCPGPRDCADGIDADLDGMVDEDAAQCTSPPVVTCPANVIAPVLAARTLTATATDNAGVVAVRWSVPMAPMGSTVAPTPADMRTTTFEPLLAGAYRLRFTAGDTDGQLSACELTYTATVTDAFRVELLWNLSTPEGMDPSDVDLHLLHPTAPAWFDGNLDCFYGNCVRATLPWGTASADDDPRLDVDDTTGRGPENTNIFRPELNAAYRVGVHYYSDHGFGPSTAIVRIYCYGQLQQSFGPVTLANGAGTPRGPNDFWKVADVTFGATTCAIAPLTNGMGGPLIVQAQTALTAR